MIRITRPARVPEVLLTRGKAENARLCALVSRHRTAIASGSKKLKFRKAIYGHKTVRKALRKAHRWKCAYCESKFAHVAFGDVEHFRPKGGIRQRPSSLLRKPGYYWLAYEWTNLLLSCQLCNQRFKKCCFTVSKGSTRARSERGSVAVEQPLLLDPTSSVVDPQSVIGWREHQPVPINNDPRARITVRVMGLARQKLAERRADKINTIRLMCDVLPALREMGAPTYHEMARFLQRAASPRAEYSAMVQAYLHQRGLLDGHGRFRID